MNMDKLTPVPVASVKSAGAFKSDDNASEKEISSAEKLPLPKRLKIGEVKEKDIEIQNEASHSSLDATKTFDDLQLLNVAKPSAMSVSVAPVEDDTWENLALPEENSPRSEFVDTLDDTEIQRKNLKSPLYKIDTFEALHLKPALLKGIYEMGFKAPLRIQETILPTLLADPPQNIIAYAPSGTGKTTAFILATLSRVRPWKAYPQVLYLLPTYELAIQAGELAAKMLHFCPEIKIKRVVKGERIHRRSRITEHIIIGTPGKVLDWGQNKFFDPAKISVFVLDDVPTISQVYQDHYMDIHKLLPQTCQRMLLSATARPEVMSFAEIIVSNPLTLRLLKEESLDNIEQYCIRCNDMDKKFTAVTKICGSMTTGQAIIFCNLKETVSWLAKKMRKDGHAVTHLSGDLTLERRITALDRFKTGLERVLITTNVLARGIYVEEVTIMINFDMPKEENRQANYEVYLYRIGTLGRFGKSGVAINLVDSLHARQLCKEIAQNFGKNIPLVDADGMLKIIKRLDKPNAMTISVPSVKDDCDSKSDDAPKDPNSPLYSVKTFDALHLKPDLLKGVHLMGFNALSKTQENILPILLADPPQNVIAQSQFGTGKTVACILAMLSRVDPKKKYPQVIYLSPTYELAMQTGEIAAKMSRFCPEIKIKYAVKGEEVSRGSKINEHIIIGTPDKVLDWGQKLKFFNLSKISVFVLCEADVMIATQGHQDQCKRIHKLLPRTCQMMVFCVTYDQELMDFSKIINKPLIIQLEKDKSLDNIKQYCIRCKNVDDKYAAITDIYSMITIGQAIIFCNTKRTVRWLAEKMTKDGHAVATLLSSDLTSEQGISALNKFRAGLDRVLITTNVLLRGIYVEQVTIVINFDLPMASSEQKRQVDCEMYLHRVRKIGRFGKSGSVINLIDSLGAVQLCEDLERYFNKEMHYLNANDADEIEKIDLIANRTAEVCSLTE